MLTLRSFPLRNAGFHWRSNVPVALGVAIGTAVLVGALVVGDSLRGSLRARTERQLNGVGASYVGPKLVRADVAKQLPAQVIPALLLQGSVHTTNTDGDPRRLGRVTVIGMSDWVSKSPFVGDLAGKSAAVAVVSARVAAALGVEKGTTIELGVERFSAVPRSSLLGQRNADDVTTALRVEVVRVLPDDDPANDFNLTPSPAAPLNVYVPLAFLQARLEKPGKVNALLTRSGDVAELNRAFAANLSLDDWGLRVRPTPKGYLSIESEQLVLDPGAVAAIEKATADLGLHHERTFTYLINAISAGNQPVWTKDAGDPNKLIPYSTVAAVDPVAVPPLALFPPFPTPMTDDEIVLTDWPDSPLRNLKPGEPVTLTYFKPEMETGAEETSATLTFRGFIPLAGPTDDPNLTPPFPGITDKLTIGEWKSPFPMNSRRVKPRDEKYWDRYRTTPKAYITRSKGEQLWCSRFGAVTSVRVAPAPGQTPEQTAEALRGKLLASMNPTAAGLTFDPTRERVLKASRGGTDFAVLLLMFSGLLIGTALLLVGLLFRLAMERRAKEVGLLLASGYLPWRVRALLVQEGTVVAAAGALLGVGLALGYAELMLFVLTELWPDPEVARFLRLDVQPVSLIVGFFAALVIATVTVWFSVRTLVKVAPPALLRGVTAVPDTNPEKPRRLAVPIAIAVVVGLCGLGAIVGGTTRSNPDERSMGFFLGGGLLVLAGLLVARAVLRRQPTGLAHGTFALGLRNTRRNVMRSLLTATLIALAAFLIVSVESFRRRPDADFANIEGGSGGYPLVAEADVPVFNLLDQPAGHDDLIDRLQPDFQAKEARNPSISRQQLTDEAVKDLASAAILPFRLRGGDDASCLNLYQAGRPRVLGVPDRLIERGGFRFGETVKSTPNPWTLLQEEQPDGAIPVIAEQNTAMFMLKTLVGGTLRIQNEMGNEVTVRLVGVLQDSVFQSELLMSDANFRTLYPRQEGFRMFLIDAPAEKEDRVKHLLETGLRTNGMTVTRSRDKVAAYQAVVGAYLTTFQLLGGFALMLAVVGLGVVVLRSVWERVGELALLRAVGYETRDLQRLILGETLLVLVVGLGIGVAAAVVSVLPNYALGGSVPWVRLSLLLGTVTVTGVVVAVVATAGVARAPLIPALRND
jgi:ABC-type antimicrobial peptide transport system permease subunit